MPKRTEMALPVPTKSLLEMNSDAAVLLICTLRVHSPTSPYHALSAEASPKDIAKSYIMKLKVS